MMLAAVKLFMGIITISFAVVVIALGIGASYLNNFEDDDYVDDEVEFPKKWDEED